MAVEKKVGRFENMPVMWWVKFALILIATVFSIMYSVPTFLGDPKEWPRDNAPIENTNLADQTDVHYTHWYHRLAAAVLPSNRVSLGLDLRGGLHLVLEVDAEKSVKESLIRSVTRARDTLESQGVKLTDLRVNKDYSVSMTVNDPSKKDAVGEAVTRQTSLLLPPLVSGNEVTFPAKEARIEEEKVHILQQAINTIRNRIDQFSVSEPNIFQYGAERVVVQLPGMKEPERAKQLIGNTAKLDFRLVLNEIPAEQLPDLLAQARKALNIPEDDIKPETLSRISMWLQDQKKISTNAVIMLHRVYNTESGTAKLVQAIPYLLESNSRLTGELVEDARADNQGGGMLPEPGVSLTFKPLGAKIFGELTTQAYKRENSTQQIAIVLDGNVNSAPEVNEPILGGTARIRMGRGNDEQKMTEAQDLALVLRAGALPATVRVVEERQVGPSEGEENIHASLLSSGIATLLIIAFMIYIYGNSGVVANIAMILNVFIILACLAAFGATLTLPGIAGITLSLATAVDGNVVINERIREEIRRGDTQKTAFYKGYNASFLTLMDVHTTTASAGIILLMYGNPSVKGFAVTMLLGAAATLFTSYYVTEVIGQWLVEKTNLKRFH